MSPEEIERRRPVWNALSELWLDTDLDEADRECLAEVLARSPFDERELRAIHDAEVASAVAANLDSVAGEWGGFDPHWLEHLCLQAALRRRGLMERVFERLRARGQRADIADMLDDLLARVVRLRSLS